MLLSLVDESLNKIMIGGDTQASVVGNETVGIQSDGTFGNLESTMLDEKDILRSFKEISQKELKKRLNVFLPPAKVKSMARFSWRWRVRLF